MLNFVQLPPTHYKLLDLLKGRKGTLMEKYSAGRTTGAAGGSSPAVPKIFGCKTWREGLETNGNLKSCVVRPQVDFVRWYYRLFMATHREGALLLCGCCVAGGLLLGPEASKSFSEDRAACPRGAWGADRSVGAF